MCLLFLITCCRLQKLLVAVCYENSALRGFDLLCLLPSFKCCDPFLPGHFSYGYVS